MSKQSILITVGALIMISPFIGIPLSWLSVLLPLFGATVVAVGFIIRRERRMPPSSPPITEAMPLMEARENPSAIA